MPQMCLAQELKAIFSRSRGLGEGLDFEKMTSQYRNSGTISDVTNLWRVSMGVKLDKVQMRFSENSTFQHTLDT
jgi:hypothetical protein